MPAHRRAICRQGDPPFNPTGESPEPSVHLGSRLMSSHSAGRPWNATPDVLTQGAQRNSQKVHHASVFEYLPLQIGRHDQTDIGKPFRLKHLENDSMSPAELSSMKWESDGELSSQDTWNLVKKLTKVEEQTKASNLLQLSSKHSHAKRPRAQREVQRSTAQD
mgnify:CR=1 FL=1